jgi:AcrR family transcriptional regulator
MRPVAAEPRPRSRRSSLAYERILEAAAARIAQDGIDAVRLSRIAQDAGVSSALIHYHFDTREALLVEALHHANARTERTREEWERLQRNLTHVQRMANMVDRTLPITAEDTLEWKLWVELWAQAHRHPELHAVVEELYAGYRSWWVRTLEAGAAAGEFDPPADPGAVAEHMTALLDGEGIRVLLGIADVEAARAAILRRLAADLGLAATRLHPAL